MCRACLYESSTKKTAPAKEVDKKSDPLKSNSEGRGGGERERQGTGGAMTAGRKREMEGHTPTEHQEKHRKHEGRGLHLSSVLGPGANLVEEEGGRGGGRRGGGKAMQLTDEGDKVEGLEDVFKKRTRTDICEHQHRRSRCRDCGGSGICEHQIQRCTCKEYGGSNICEHQRVKSQCKDCGGGSICEHQRVRSRCKDCSASGLCEHQRQRTKCKESKTAAAAASASIRGGGVSVKTAVAGGFCEHQRQRHKCKQCGGSSICKHQRHSGATANNVAASASINGCGKTVNNAAPSSSWVQACSQTFRHQDSRFVSSTRSSHTCDES